MHSIVVWHWPSEYERHSFGVQQILNFDAFILWLVSYWPGLNFNEQKESKEKFRGKNAAIPNTCLI